MSDYKQEDLNIRVFDKQYLINKLRKLKRIVFFRTQIEQIVLIYTDFFRFFSEKKDSKTDFMPSALQFLSNAE